MLRHVEKANVSQGFEQTAGRALVDAKQLGQRHSYLAVTQFGRQIPQQGKHFMQFPHIVCMGLWPVRERRL